MKYYSKDHEWIEVDGDGAILGISIHAANELGDITYVELPPEEADVIVGDTLGVVESVKAASDIFSPVSGIVVEVNSELETEPGLINKSPYEKGWLAKVKISDTDELSNLMTADEYTNFLESAG